MKIRNMVEYTNEVDVCKDFTADLIRVNRNMWEKMDKCIYNYSCIPIFEYDTIKEMFTDRLHLKTTTPSSNNNRKKKNQILLIEEDDDEDDGVVVVDKPALSCRRQGPVSDAKELQEKSDIIDVKYINCYADYFKIICSLKNDDIRHYKLALHITKKSKHFRQEQWFKEVWDGISTGKYNYSLGTFNYYAKMSNEKSYFEIIAKYRKTEIGCVLKQPTEENIAKCYHALFGEDFLYNNKRVYHWNGIVWEQSETALRRCFVKEFTQIFLNCQISNLNDMKNYSADSEEYKALHDKNKTYTKIITLLQNNKIIKNVCNDAIKTYIENNDVKFENNPNTFCFKNKVFDLQKCEFVEPSKDDYMTLTTGYDFREPTKEEIKTLEDAFKKVFPFEEERTLYLTFLATTLYGKTMENFVFATGSGRNGKGFTNELAMKMLGNYGYTCGNAVLLQPIKDGANQSVANMHNMRGIFYREPDSGVYSKINSSSIKELSGGNLIHARGIYSSNTDTHLKGSHFLECNSKPDMSGEIEEAIIMRLIIVEFISTFTKSKEDVNEAKHIYWGDDNVKDPLFQENHKLALFRILIGYWKKYIESGMNINEFIPPFVKDRVKHYMSKSNKMMNWFIGKYEQVISDESEPVIKIKDIFDDYKNSNDYSNYNKMEKRNMTQEKFIEFFEKNAYTKRYYKHRYQRNGVNMRNVLIGFRLIPEDVNDSSSDIEDDE